VEPKDALGRRASSSIVLGVEMGIANAVETSISESPPPRTADVAASVGVVLSPQRDPDVVTPDVIVDAPDQAVDEFEKLGHSRICHPKEKSTCVCSDLNTRKRKLPVFSDESSETEYNSDSESGLSITSPTFLQTKDCATSGYVGIHDVVLIHLSSDFDCSVNILD